MKRPIPIQKNPMIATSVRNFINKKSGQVVVARQDIKRRFDYVDWKYQRQIVPAFLLSSSASDRQWIYPKLMDVWDDSFFAAVQQVWEQYHEKQCGWLIIRYFPLEYIETYTKELMRDRNYYFLCKRFMNTAGFTIEPLRIENLRDRIDILSQQKVPIAEIEPLLIKEIQYICNNASLTTEEIHNKAVYGYVSLLDIKAIYAVYMLLHRNGYDIGCRLMEKWDGDIRRSLNQSQELAELRRNEQQLITYDRKVIVFSVKYILAYFGVEYHPAFYFNGDWENENLPSDEYDAYEEYYHNLDADKQAADNAITWQDDMPSPAEKELKKRHQQQIRNHAIGKSFVTTQAFTIGYLIHYFAPYTDSGRIRIEAGVVLTNLSSMNDTCLYCDCADENLIRTACEKAYEESFILKDRFNGISFFIDCEQIEQYCKEIVSI